MSFSYFLTVALTMFLNVPLLVFAQKSLDGLQTKAQVIDAVTSDPNWSIFNPSDDESSEVRVYWCCH